jgi:hypothetical protein
MAFASCLRRLYLLGEFEICYEERRTESIYWFGRISVLPFLLEGINSVGLRDTSTEVMADSIASCVHTGAPRPVLVKVSLLEFWPWRYCLPRRLRELPLASRSFISSAGCGYSTVGVTFFLGLAPKPNPAL